MAVDVPDAPAPPGAALRDGGAPPAAEALRRAVVCLGAALVVALPRFTAAASFEGVPGGLGPMATLLAATAFWAMPTLLVASWAAAARIRVPHPGLTVPVLLLAVGAVVSTWTAADATSAAVRAVQLTGLWAALWALAQAVRTEAERRVLLAAVVASALLAAVVAIYQATAGFPEAFAYFQAHREEVLAEQGISPGSWQEAAYVERFTGGVQAAMGHPNVLAAMLVAATLLALGLAREKWSEAPARGAKGLAVPLVLVAAGLVAALWLTQSRGGLAALGVGVWWLGVAWTVRRRRLRWALWVAPVALALAAGAWLVATGHPAGLSLAYRLDYWRGTAGVLQGHWLTGTGLENFRHQYLQHKPATAPEEIADPHNLWLAAWSQLGVAGLAAAVGLVVVAARHWLATARRAAGGAEAQDDAGGRGNLAAWVGAAAALAAPVVVFLMVTRALAPQGVLVVGAVGAVLVWGLALAEDPQRLSVPGRRLGGLHAAGVAAALAFLLQGQIGTAFLVPATAWVLAVLVAATLRPGPTARAWRLAPLLGAALMLVPMAGALLLARGMLLPVGRQGMLLREAARVLEPEGAEALLLRAEAARPTAWEPAMRRGRLWQDVAAREQGAQAAILAERAIEAYEAALARHPRLREAWLRTAECRLLTQGALTSPSAMTLALAALEEAVRLYPTDLGTVLRQADLLDRLGRRGEARAAYERLLALDAAMRLATRKLSPALRGRVEARGRALEAGAAEP